MIPLDYWLLDDDRATPPILERHWRDEDLQLPIILASDETDEETAPTWVGVLTPADE